MVIVRPSASCRQKTQTKLKYNLWEIQTCKSVQYISFIFVSSKKKVRHQIVCERFGQAIGDIPGSVTDRIADGAKSSNSVNHVQVSLEVMIEFRPWQDHDFVLWSLVILEILTSQNKSKEEIQGRRTLCIMLTCSPSDWKCLMLNDRRTD